jgi:mono/diheme cytochrome c family protein
MIKGPFGSRAAGLLCTGVAFCTAATAILLLQTRAHAESAGIFDSTPFISTDGKQIFERICQGCHMPDAGGAVGAGNYPALANNPTLSSRQYMALTILMGRRNMPAFGAKHAIGFAGPPVVLSTAQIAAVINYVRSNFGNHYTDAISAAEVATLDLSAKP